MYYAYVGEVNSNLICCVCHTPFLNPTITTTCAHTFCRDCIVRSLESQPCCPVDRSPLSLADLKPENLLLRNLVDELIVQCLNEPLGCEFTCQRQLLDLHLREECDYVQVVCSEEGCDQTVFRKDIGKLTHDCVHRVMKCEACGASVKASDFEAHTSECLESDVPCPACSLTLKRATLAAHTAACPSLPIPCTQSSNGCPWSGARSALPSHTDTCPFEAIKGFFGTVEARVAALHAENVAVRRRLDGAEDTIRVLWHELEGARRALGPWWKPGAASGSSSGSDAQVSTVAPPPSEEGRTGAAVAAGPSAAAQFPTSETPSRWRSPSALAPIAPFSPEAASASAMHEQEALGGSQAYVDASLASYFPVATDYVGASSTSSSPPAISSPDSTHASTSTNTLRTHPFFSTRAFPQRFPDASSPYALPLPPLPLPTPQHLRMQIPPLPTSTPLLTTLTTLHTTTTSLASAVDALARRTDVGLAAENLRMNEEVGTLRAVVHGLRMQVHVLVTERNASGVGGAGTHLGWPPGGQGAGYYGTAHAHAQQPGSTIQSTKL